LPPGESDSVIITFDPTSSGEGLFDSVMVILCNDPEKEEIAVPLKIAVSTIKWVEPLPDLLVNEGFGTEQVDFSGVFSSNGPLTYIVVSSNTQVVTVDTSGLVMTLTEQGTGKAMITVRAGDNNGHAMYDDFWIRVNAHPVVIRPVPDIEMESNQSYSVDLDTVFFDSDGDTLVYTVSGDPDSLLTLSLDGSVLTVQGTGEAWVYLTADDGIGEVARDTFGIRILIPVGVTALHDGRVALYPNPARDHITCKVRGETLEDVLLQITNSTGQIVYERYYGMLNTETIPVHTFRKGMFLVRIVGKKEVIIRRFIKE